MANPSPEWKKPADVMKLRRRKSIGTDLHDGTVKNRQPMRLSLEASSPGRKPLKRKNPFLRSSVESKKLELNTLADTLNTLSSSSVNQLNSDSLPDNVEEDVDLKHQQRQDYFRKALESESYTFNSSCNSSSEMPVEFSQEMSTPFTRTPPITHITQASDNCKTLGSRTFPFDWSLKTKVRFVSSCSLSWCTSLRGVDESHGTNSFVSGSSPFNIEDLKNDENMNARQQFFQKQLMFWVHPNIPWLQTFPRITNSVRQFGSQSNSLIQNEDVTKALYNDWCNSMNSAFLMVRSGLCPYLYVCCHHMTILFRAAGVGRDSLHALLTPTTKGLRAALDSEGIDYTLPLRQQQQRAADSVAKQSSTENSQPANDNDDDDDDDERDENNADDSAASSWLQDLGLDKKQFRSLEPSKIRDENDIYREIDRRPESTVMVEGTADTQALLNYLLNCTSLFAASGPQAGVPPTMLAPVAFAGATLQSLKVRQGNILNQMADGQRKHMFTLELTGPILPHCIAGMSQLFLCSTHGDFTATFAVHEPTKPLNCLLGECSTTSETTASSLSSSARLYLANDICSHSCNAALCKSAVHELACESELFRWTC